MAAILAGNWWVFAARGVLAILLAVFAFARPDITFTFLVLLFGAYAFFDGLFAIAAALEGVSPARRWWAVLLEGVVGLTIGILTFTAPPVVGLGIIWAIAFWAVLTGIFEILAAFRLRRSVRGEWWLALAGVLSILLGILVFVNPAAGALWLAWLLGAYALLFGVTMFGLAIRLRHWARVTGRGEV
jgi:uncharacterized membrane protein HdeD (DUF308 family)